MTPTLARIPAAYYHADRIGHGDRPSLSASVAATLVNESPYHAWLRHPRFGCVAKPATPEMDRGSVIHSVVFGAGPQVEIIPADDYRTKAAQALRDEAHSLGRVPMLAREFEYAFKVGGQIADGMVAAGIVLSGESEVAAVWEEDTPAGPVLCRGQMDHVVINRALVIDLKTCTSAHPRQIARSVYDRGYDVQYAAYTSAVRALRPDLAGREEFVWVFAELPEPKSGGRVVLTVARPSGATRELGRQRWERACAAWGQCLATDHWPAYSVGPVEIDPPGWAMKEEGL